MHKVLYVDDEETNLRVFKNSFRRDFEIFTATSAEEGLEILKNVQVDVIITDQRMPGMSGVEFLEAINKKHPQIPPNRLIVSGYAQDKDISEAFNKFHLFQFVSKPWDYEKLLDIINCAINNCYE